MWILFVLFMASGTGQRLVNTNDLLVVASQATLFRRRLLSRQGKSKPAKANEYPDCGAHCHGCCFLFEISTT
jgi:hypothetical protein